MALDTYFRSPYQIYVGFDSIQKLLELLNKGEITLVSKPKDLDDAEKKLQRHRYVGFYTDSLDLAKQLLSLTKNNPDVFIALAIPNPEWVEKLLSLSL